MNSFCNDISMIGSNRSHLNEIFTHAHPLILRSMTPMNYIFFVYFSKITLDISELNPIVICIWFKDSLRKKQQPPVSSTPVAVSSPQQQTQNFSSPASVTHTAQPTVQSLQQPHIETIKDVSIISINDRNSRILFDLDWLTGPFFFLLLIHVICPRNRNYLKPAQAQLVK